MQIARFREATSKEHRQSYAEMHRRTYYMKMKAHIVIRHMMKFHVRDAREGAKRVPLGCLNFSAIRLRARKRKIILSATNNDKSAMTHATSDSERSSSLPIVTPNLSTFLGHLTV